MIIYILQCYSKTKIIIKYTYKQSNHAKLTKPHNKRHNTHEQTHNLFQHLSYNYSKRQSFIYLLPPPTHLLSFILYKKKLIITKIFVAKPFKKKVLCIKHINNI